MADATTNRAAIKNPEKSNCNGLSGFIDHMLPEPLLPHLILYKNTVNDSGSKNYDRSSFTTRTI